MKLLIAFAGFMLWAAPLLAETYSWVDEKGTYNFTEDYSRIPIKYRNSVEKRDGIEAPPAPSSAAPAVSAGSPANAAAGTGKDETKAPQLYGGKTRAAWEQELTTAQNEVKRHEARIKELEVQLKNAGAYNVTRSHAEQQQQYLDSVNNFNKASARFFELMESARKAGLNL